MPWSVRKNVGVTVTCGKVQGYKGYLFTSDIKMYTGICVGDVPVIQ